MIIGLGLDVVEISRIGASWGRFGLRFAERILSERELAMLPERPEAYLASRFAAKEAGVKALGTGFSCGIGFRDLEVVRLASGQPVLELSGRALERFRELGADKAHLSLTHGRDVAAAVVVLERPL